jgi:hypothetical protein
MNVHFDVLFVCLTVVVAVVSHVVLRFLGRRRYRKGKRDEGL